MKTIFLSTCVFFTSIFACTLEASAHQRAYNMILTERTFNHQTHCYALLGLERSSGQWNLLGGKRDPSDITRGSTAARELYEESGMALDKRGDRAYWSSLPAYEFEEHKVFVHQPGNLPVRIKTLNYAGQKAIANRRLKHDYKEMSEYTLIKLQDLIDLSQQQHKRGSPGTYHHYEKGPIQIDGWLLYTLKNGNINALNAYRY